MEVRDEAGNVLEEWDEGLGDLVEVSRIRPGAAPVDDESKFAWDAEDYEEFLLFVPHGPEERLRRRIQEAEEGLRATDYVAAKAMDALLGCSSVTELLAAVASLGSEYAEVLAKRRAWRAEAGECREALADAEGGE